MTFEFHPFHPLLPAAWCPIQDRAKKLTVAQALKLMQPSEEGGRAMSSLAQEDGLAGEPSVSKIVNSTPSMKALELPEQRPETTIVARNGKYSELEKALLQWIHREQGEVKHKRA